VGRRQLNIQFHPHAIDRLPQRLPGMRKEQLRGRLRRRIAAELRKGAMVDERGALKIEVISGTGVWAVCYPSLMGGWEIKTVIKKGWEEDMEERARYHDNEQIGEQESEQTSEQKIRNTWNIDAACAHLNALAKKKGWGEIDENHKAVI